MATSLEGAQYELLSNIAELFNTGLCSDLQIDCGTRIFKVHKAIICVRSPVLRKACENDKWKEGRDCVLVIGRQDSRDYDDSDPSDDPAAVEMMLHFMYRGDYEPGDDPYDTAGTTSDNDTETQRWTSDVLIGTTTCEPYGNSSPADDNAEPGLAPDETAFDVVDEHESSASDLTTKADDHANEMNKELDLRNMSSGILDLHARVYALGHKYEMPALCSTALHKFRSDAERLVWHDMAFCAALTTIYSFTPARCADIRNVVVAKLHQQFGLHGISPDIEEHISNTPELAIGLWKRAIQERRGPHCDICGTVEVRACTVVSYDAYNRATYCSNQFVACKCTPETESCGDCSRGHRSKKKVKKQAQR